MSGTDHSLRKRKSVAKSASKRPRNTAACTEGSACAERWLTGVASDAPVFSLPVKTFDLDLALPLEQRWIDIAEAYREPFRALLHKNHDAFADFESVPGVAAALLKLSLPTEQQEEIAILSKLLDAPHKLLVLVQLVYEVFSLTDALDGASVGCTTAIKSVRDGVVHARTLDWKWLDGLEELLIDLNVKRGQTRLYQCIGFVGLVGALTGIRFATQGGGAFSLSLNYRRPFQGSWFKDDNDEMQPALDVPPLWRNGHVLAAAVHGCRRGWPMASLLRHLLASCCTFDEAVVTLRSSRLLAPGFIAVAGGRPHEGVIMSRDAGLGVHEQWLGDVGSTICVANVDPHGTELPDLATVRLLGDALGSAGAKDIMQGESFVRRDFFLWLAAAAGDDCETACDRLQRAMLMPPLANDVTIHATTMCAAASHMRSHRSPGPWLLGDAEWDSEIELCARCCYSTCRQRVACTTSRRSEDSVWGSVLRRRGGGYYCAKHVPLKIDDLSTRGG